MTREEKIEFIENLGYSPYQALTIYKEMGCDSLNTQEALENAASEWLEDEQEANTNN